MGGGNRYSCGPVIWSRDVGACTLFASVCLSRTKAGYVATVQAFTQILLPLSSVFIAARSEWNLLLLPFFSLQFFLQVAFSAGRPVWQCQREWGGGPLVLQAQRTSIQEMRQGPVTKTGPTLHARRAFRPTYFIILQWLLRSYYADYVEKVFLTTKYQCFYNKVTREKKAINNLCTCGYPCQQQWPASTFPAPSVWHELLHWKRHL